MPQAPWTEIGRLQSDISSIESRLHSKVEQYDIDNAVASVKGTLDCLENTVRELGSEVDGFRARMQEMEEKIQMILDKAI